MARIFQDDPDAIEQLETRLSNLEKIHTYWKGLKPEPRSYGPNETDNMKRCYMLPNITTKIRIAKKKLDSIKARAYDNVKLVRKTTFKNGRKVFYYEEVKEE